MLIEFSVGNYRSFRDQVTLSMIAANLNQDEPTLVDIQNIIPVDGDLNLLKTCAIYGANASGKSNIIKAFEFMRGLILNSARESSAADPTGVQPFRLSVASKSQPSYFQAIFMLSGTQYCYGFEVNQLHVTREWLRMALPDSDRTLFEREGQSITVSAHFDEGKDLASRVRPNALFLSVITQFNGPVSTAIWQWFFQTLIISGLDSVFSQSVTETMMAVDFKTDELNRIIRGLDVGIESIEVERDEKSAEMSSLLTSFYTGIRRPERKITTLHQVYNTSGEPIGFEEFVLSEDESEGTKKIFGLAGYIAFILEFGTCLFIDEFDARLHPNLTRSIVELFHNPETNPKKAQLIFATHDSNLLRPYLFRRDQIWFTEKNREGASQLYSLAEFDIPENAFSENDYLWGRYGAIPHLGDIAGAFRQREPGELAQDPAGTRVDA